MTANERILRVAQRPPQPRHRRRSNNRKKGKPAKRKLDFVDIVTIKPEHPMRFELVCYASGWDQFELWAKQQDAQIVAHSTENGTDRLRVTIRVPNLATLETLDNHWWLCDRV